MKSALWDKFPKGPLTTGIGSLPHANVDAALTHSFKTTVPFLPQLPIRNPKEFMLVQALRGLPGVQLEEGGFVTLEVSAWEAGTAALREKTEKAFAASEPDAFSEFEPVVEYWSAWNPFLFELEEQQKTFAKIQLAGPMTAQWSVKTSKEMSAAQSSELGIQIFRLSLAHSIAMSRKLQSLGVTPLFYLDEPGFYGFSIKNPKHHLAFQELKLFIQSLKKEGTLVGLHCCSNTDWESILSLPLDVLSFDTNLSLPSVLGHREPLKRFIENGGRLSLGVVPTGMQSVKTQNYTPELIWEHLQGAFVESLRGEAAYVQSILEKALITPACGLALHSVEDAEMILKHTLSVAKRCQPR